MGYNISEVTGATGSGDDGLGIWTFDVALDDPSVTTVSGDFDVVLSGALNVGDANRGYDFSVESGGAFGTLDSDSVTGEFTFTIDREAVFATGSDQTVVLSVTGETRFSGERLTDTDTVNINLLICVARGTLIDTGDGPVPVERLRPGDKVTTLDHGAQPVRWIGRRKVSGWELQSDPSLRPVRIAAGAFGGGRPARDLTVSPQHRLLMGGARAALLFGESEVLVPAKALVNDTTIRVDHAAQEVEYFHVLFDRHEIMVTEGLPTESFHAGDYSLRELGAAARAELFAAFPELRSEEGQGDTARLALRPWEGALLRDVLPQDDARPWEVAA